MTSLPTWARSPIVVAAAVITYAIFAWLVLRASVTLRSRIGARLRGLRVRQVELVSAGTLERLFMRALTVARIFLLLSGAYAALVAVLYGVGASRTVFDLVTQPLLTVSEAALEGILGFIPNALRLLIVLFVTRIAVGLVHRFFQHVGPHRVFLTTMDPSLVRPTRRLVILGIWILGVVMAAPYLPGAGSRAFQGITIFLGVLVSLGSSTLVGNLLAGLQLTYSRAYREGDRVQLGDVYGDVIELGTFATKVRTIQKEEVTIPNALAQTWPVTNYTHGLAAGVEVKSEVTIGYDAPWRKVHELLIAAARATRGVRVDSEPYVLQRALDDFYVRYQINARIDEPSRHHLIRSELNQNIQDVFFRAGVEICSPHFTALRDGNRVAIPPAQLPADYDAPRFRIEAPPPLKVTTATPEPARSQKAEG
jgi:small-conductance mechanosensitive channel